MTTTKRVKGTAASMPVGIAWGVFASVLITSMLAAVLTWLVFKGDVKEKVLGYFVMGILLVASALGALLSAVKIKRRWMLVCCLTGGVYYLVLLGSTILFFGGNYYGIGVTGLLVLIGSLIPGILGIKRSWGRDQGYRKYRTR